MLSDEYVSALHYESEKELIIIDAGHGGEDPGAISKSGIYEKNLNLDFALIIGALLSEQGYAVVYTRTTDKLLYTAEENIKGIRKISDLKNRCKIAAEYPDALFVSIHMNSFSNEKYSGLQVYYSENNADSYVLADKIQSTVCSQIQPTNSRTIKKANAMYVLDNINNPAVLVECGFLSNAEESEKLSEKEYQKQLSLSIVCAIIEYKEMKSRS